MSRYNLLLSLFFASCFILANGSRLATAEAGPAFQDTSTSTMCSGGKNGTPLMDEMVRHVKDMGDYKFDGTVNSVKGEKVVRATGIFYYKPANEIRVEVKDYGSKSGSILVKTKDGKVIGKGGKSMLGMKMTLSPDSRLAMMPNGVSAVQCDLMSLLDRIKREVGSSGKLVTSGEPVKVESLPNPVIILEGQLPGESMATRIFIDPSQKLPIQWDLFDGGKFSSRCMFKSYEAKENWDDSQFQL